MDPFRDELNAAHAKIAQLEERGRDLEKALADAHRPEPSPTPPEPSPPSERTSSESTSSLVVVFLLTLILFAVAAVVLIAIGRRTTESASSTDYKGVATAGSADPYQPHPPIPKEAFEPAPRGTASAKCNCTPGDPLCTCL